MDCWDYAEVCGRYGTKIKCIGSRMGDSLMYYVLQNFYDLGFSKLLEEASGYTGSANGTNALHCHDEPVVAMYALYLSVEALELSVDDPHAFALNPSLTQY